MCIVCCEFFFEAGKPVTFLFLILLLLLLLLLFFICVRTQVPICIFKLLMNSFAPFYIFVGRDFSSAKEKDTQRKMLRRYLGERSTAIATVCRQLMETTASSSSSFPSSCFARAQQHKLHHHHHHFRRHQTSRSRSKIAHLSTTSPPFFLASASTSSLNTSSTQTTVSTKLSAISATMHRQQQRKGYAKAAKKGSQSKSKASQGRRSKSKSGGGMGEIKRDPKLDAALDKYMNLLVKAVEPTEIKPQKLTQAQLEEYEAKAKEYSRKKMEQHRAMQKDLNDKIRLKAAACNALPEGFLREHAWTEDRTLFSPKRRMPVATPSIQGYAENKLAADEAAVISNVGLGKR